MAYELYPFPHGGVLRGALEDAYNSDPTVADGDTYHCPTEASFNSFKRTMTPRAGQSAFIGGFKPTTGMAEGEYNIDVMVDHYTLPGSTVLTPSASIANVPSADLWWRAGGFVGTYAEDADYSGIKPDQTTLSAGNNDRILTYTYKPRHGQTNSSAKLVYTEINDGGDEGRTHTLVGARHEWTLTIPGGERVVLSCQGKSLATTIAKDSNPTTDSSLPNESEAVGLGGNVSLTAVADTVTYGKAAEADNASVLNTKALAISDLEITSNLSINGLTSPSGTYGIAAQRYAPSPEGLTASFRLQQVTFEDDFNIENFRDARKILRMSVVLAHPTDANSFIKVTFEGFITEIAYGNTDSYRDATITMQLGYPDSSSDGGGLKPAELLTVQYVTIVAA